MHQQIPNGIIEDEAVVLAFEVDPIKESWTDYTGALPKDEIDRAGGILLSTGQTTLHQMQKYT